MKSFITYCFVFTAFLLKAQTINLDFQPKGQIIEFHFNGLTIYTDTSSFFYANSHDAADGAEYKQKIKSAVLHQFKTGKKDTAVFLNDVVPLEDNKGGKFQKNWFVEPVILILTKEKKLKIIDKHRHLVKTIVTKISGTKKEGRIIKTYYNKDTKEELLVELLFLRT